MLTILTDAARSYRFDVRQFRRMMIAGIFENHKVELVAGKIYVMTDLPPHTFALETFREALRVMLSRGQWTIREEKPVLMGQFWAPKPDLSVLRGDNSHYASRLPRSGDVALLVEVADTTYQRDRGRKWRRYAAVGIPIYIIVRLKGPDTFIEVWTGPTGRGVKARYTDVIRYSAQAGESVPVELEGLTLGHIAVADLVAPQA
jgi:Putative restriction endonuclease